MDQNDLTLSTLNATKVALASYATAVRDYCRF